MMEGGLGNVQMLGSLFVLRWDGVQILKIVIQMYTNCILNISKNKIMTIHVYVLNINVISYIILNTF